MKLRLEATPDELAAKSSDLVLGLAEKLAKFNTALAYAAAPHPALPILASKASVLYMHRPGASYTCGDCASFVSGSGRCLEHAADEALTADDTCGLWSAGKPRRTGTPKGHVTPEESGLIHGVGDASCKTCLFFVGDDCLRVARESPGATPGRIDPDAACNAYKPGAGRIPRTARPTPASATEATAAGARTFAGLEVVVENPAGTVRTWSDAKTGRTGQTTMRCDYGFIVGTDGADGDEYDVFLGPDESAPLVFVVHQARPDVTAGDALSAYDEDKALVGFANIHDAIVAYLVHYDDPAFLGAMSVVPIEEFRQKVHGTLEDGMLKSVAAAPALASSAASSTASSGTRRRRRGVVGGPGGGPGGGGGGGPVLFVDGTARSRTTLEKTLAAEIAAGPGPDRHIVNGSTGMNVALDIPHAESAPHETGLLGAMAELTEERAKAPRVIRDRRTYDFAGAGALGPKPFVLIEVPEGDLFAEDNLADLEARVERRHTEAAEAKVVPRSPS